MLFVLWDQPSKLDHDLHVFWTSCLEEHPQFACHSADMFSGTVFHGVSRLLEQAWLYSPGIIFACEFTGKSFEVLRSSAEVAPLRCVGQDLPLALLIPDVKWWCIGGNASQSWCLRSTSACRRYIRRGNQCVLQTSTTTLNLLVCMRAVYANQKCAMQQAQMRLYTCIILFAAPIQVHMDLHLSCAASKTTC